LFVISCFWYVFDHFCFRQRLEFLKVRLDLYLLVDLADLLGLHRIYHLVELLQFVLVLQFMHCLIGDTAPFERIGVHALISFVHRKRKVVKLCNISPSSKWLLALISLPNRVALLLGPIHLRFSLSTSPIKLINSSLLIIMPEMMQNALGFIRVSFL